MLRYPWLSYTRYQLSRHTLDGQSFLKHRVGYELGQTHTLNVCAAGLFRWNYFYRLVYGDLNEILINVGEDVTVV